MAKITYKGLWIELKSLDKDAKRKYILCNIFLLAGAILFGIHLAAVGGLGIEVNEEVSPSPVLVIVRVLSLTFMLVAAWLYKDFFATQDEFLNRYNEFMLSNGAIGFLFVGFLISILSPYIDYQVTFYEYFIGFALGTVIGGYRFHKKFIS
jgi:hypothetical protein|tara:strand:- start:579 stop:1031 length:453 start_codon:yes stop_codon:yes gene_type:complete